MTELKTILIYSSSYLLFFALAWLSKEKKGIRLLDENGPVRNRRMLMLLHTGGILLFGVLPVYFFNYFSRVVFGNIDPEDYISVPVTGMLVILSLIIAPSLAKKQSVRNPRLVTPGISFSSIFISNYFVVRVLFLCAYETWWRGYLLTDCISSFGVVPAVLINVSFYTLLHVLNGKKEMLACIPFGLLQCGLCIWAGAAWPAILLHTGFSVSYEIQQLKTFFKPSNSGI